MKGHFLTGMFLLSFNITPFAQRTYIDAAPSGKENYLPVEGGAIHMPIDSTTSLINLIDRLSGDWQFIETGKMYWIGYTNDMFSIAARGDSAIGPLVKVVETSSKLKERLGAIYTLHLIGIDRSIKGRGNEPFVNRDTATQWCLEKTLISKDKCGKRLTRSLLSEIIRSA
jgi:hypothetical protein